jgi:hypothetical protein
MKETNMTKTFLAALVLAAAIVPAVAEADTNLYGTTTEDMISSPDRYVHSRSVEEYRRIVPVEADRYGMCRNAGHVAQCVWALNGHQYPPPEPWTKALEGE